MSAPPDLRPAAHERLLYLDWLRIAAFGLLVLYHVGMYYVTWDWHVKSPHAGPALEPFMRLVSPWRMDLLFVVSGAATAFMLRHDGASGRLLGMRARRLLIPLAFGMLVVVPPQAYLEVVQRHGYVGSYLDFMRLYLAGDRGFCRAGGACLVLPTWNHLWFLPYVFLYTCVTWALLRRWPLLLERAAARVSDALQGMRLLVVPVCLLAMSIWGLKARFPVTHALVDDLFAHVQYSAMFMLGLVLARSPALPQAMEERRWVALAAALAAWGLGLAGPESAVSLGPPGGFARAVVSGVGQWGGTVAALGFAHRLLDRDSAWRRYLTDAVFPVYVLHQTVTILLAWWLAPKGLGLWLEGPLLAAGTLAFSLLGHEIVRRIPWARPFFGGQAGASVSRPACQAALGVR